MVSASGGQCQWWSVPVVVSASGGDCDLLYVEPVSNLPDDLGFIETVVCVGSETSICLTNTGDNKISPRQGSQTNPAKQTSHQSVNIVSNVYIM